MIGKKMTKMSFEKLKVLPGKNRLIGLDIGTCSVKLAELAHQQGRYVLSTLRLQEIDSSIDNKEGQLKALKNVFSPT